ncbi:MAG TPA: CpaD family pilus assembly protein [Rhizomicrobium sp.]|nr:CpaD family pilus assembly protein [Rhizomicrobium sp.]
MITKNLWRAVPVLAVLVAGSCTVPDDAPRFTQDPALNHSITVEPSYRSLKIANSETLSADDAQKLAAFAEDYLARGNGAITIAAPAGPDSSRIIASLGEELVNLGVPRAHILVGEQDQAKSDGLVEIGYIRYVAHTAPCGDWSENAADNQSNLPMPNWGCSVENNIAAQVADPRDLVGPRALGPADATRRMQVLNKYEQGQTTSAQKTAAQSAAISDVANGGSQ